MANQTDPCPCGSELDYPDCCGRYLAGAQIPVTAEALMRSRYTAYVTGNEDYLLNSWHSTTRPEVLGLENDTSTKWIGLSIKSTIQGTEQDEQGTVEFVARYKVNGKAHRLHEKSRFRKENARWYYVDGDLTS